MRDKRQRIEASWPEVYSHWQILCMSLNLPISQKVQFVDVPVPSPDNPLRIADEVLDWWPEDKLFDRRQALADLGWYGAQWHVRQGTLHTVSLLFKCREDPEALAAVLIGASLWDKRKDLPEVWRGRIYRLIDEMALLIHGNNGVFEQKGLPVWHHASREALPFNIVDEEFAQSLQPKGFRDLTHIAVIEASLSLSLWTLVRVYHEPKGVRIIE
jgi:hypothetical protein